MEYRRVFWLFTVFAVALFLLHSRTCFCELKGPPHSLEEFFGFVDQDGDGEIEQHEVTQFMASFSAEDINEDSATRETNGDFFISHSFNFSYGGNTISSEEMLDHLQNMLTADHVVEWIKHGLELPQYAEAFKNNSINGLDFPSLIENGSWTLATELGVSSPLHCKKITYAIVRQIFGYGAPPGPPRNMTCNPLPNIGIYLYWIPPQFLGYPPLHKFVIYRRGVPSSSWVPIGETKENSFLDHNVQADVVYSYRIQGWGGHGSSEWVTLTRCNGSRRIIIPKTGVKSDFSSSIDVRKELMQTHTADNVDSYSSTSFSLRETRGDKQGALNEGNNFWGWMFSVNGGLLLLGILSRQSFLFRFTLAAWVLFKVHVLQKIHLMLHQAQASQYRLLRALAHACIFVDACFMCIQAKIWLLSRQVTSIPPTLRTSSPNEKKFLSRTDTFQDAIGYSVASCTLDEMVEAIRKQQLTIRPTSSNDRIFEQAEWDVSKKISSSHLMSNDSCLAANKSSADFAHKQKRVQSAGAIYKNEEEEESNNSGSQVIDPLETRCRSAPASVDRFRSSASDSDQSVHEDNGHPEKLRVFDDAQRQKPSALTNTKRTRYSV
ncbi:hypothetical protein O6H91_06G036800 [Diphasiastrum complanatum]|uniref:Uncharacterized protein n=1 Tax=Diphasiastrum complanatum TaxID=34168 RepID=A0ACC2DDB9_DIPCM|nr:hypothetical protein O6H91_06G036800 [Diphasiastrum complanatum]